MMFRDAAAMNIFSMARTQSWAAVPVFLPDTMISTGALRMGSPMAAGLNAGAPGGGGGMGILFRPSAIRSSISLVRITVKCHGWVFMPVGA